MEFQNAGIDLSLLPKAEEVDLHPIDKRFKAVRFKEFLVLWSLLLIAFIAAVIFIDKLQELTLLIPFSAVFLFAAILNWFLVSKSIKYRAYAAREHDLIYRTGWVVQSTKVCPFNRIQHCSIDTGLFERPAGLASLKLYTSGGSDANLKIRGLSAETAASLKAFIINKTALDEQ